MTLNTIVFFIIGLIFISIGWFVCRKNKWRNIMGYISLVIGIFVVYITSIGPLSHSSAKVNQIREIDEENVESIRIQPKLPINKNIKMNFNDTVLTDKAMINDLCNSLKHAVPAPFGGYMKIPGCDYKIQINMRNKETINFGVNKFKHITCLSIKSDEKYTWHYGDLKANEFGILLDNICDQTNLE